MTLQTDGQTDGAGGGGGGGAGGGGGYYNIPAFSSKSVGIMI